MGKNSGETAIVYCRTSTKGQRDERTIQAQIAWAQDAIQRDGVTLLHYGPKKDGWVTDDGVSGSLLDGRALAALIDNIEAGTVRPDVVYVYSLSRLAREDRSSGDKQKRIKSRIDAARIAAVLGAHGIKVRDESGTNDPNSIAYDVKTSVSTEEYRGIRDKTMRGKAIKLERNVIATGGRPPYGYARVPIDGNRRNGTTYAEHPEEGPRFRQLMAWYVAGGASHAARKAMQAGWESPRGSQTWYPSTLQQLLKNIRAYLGETTRSIDGQSYAVTYPALLDLERYAAIARRMKERTLPRRTTLLSTGFTDCACGSHVHGHRSQSTSDFLVICGKRKADGLGRASCGSMSEPRFAAALWTAVVCRLLQIRQHERAAFGGEHPYGSRLADAKAKLAAVEGEIDRVLAVHLTGAIDQQTWARNNAPLQERKLAARAELDQIEREKQAHEQRAATEASVEARVEKVLTDLVKSGEPTLERKRHLLADLLAGGRVIVEWPGQRAKRESASVSITLPAFDRLPPFTVRTDQIPARFLGGTVKRGGAVHVMVQSAPRDLASGAELFEFGTVPLASVLAGHNRGAELGVRLHIPEAAEPVAVAGKAKLAATIVESTEYPTELAGPARPSGRKRRGRTTPDDAR